MVNEIIFNTMNDSRGCLVALESLRNIPFEIKRMYYIFNVEDGVSRGFHAHKKLKQVAFCVAGSCKITLDDGYQRECVSLNTPTKGLVINEMIWREMHDFSKDCILVVLANEYYDEKDYIRDYQSFLDLFKS